MSKKNVSPIISGAGFITGFITELVTAAREFGCSDEEIHRLVTPEGRETVRAMAKLIPTRRDEVTFQHGLRPESWELLEGADEPDPVDIVNLDLVAFLEEGEGSVGGEEMVRRARQLQANGGQRQAKHLLAHQAGIPEEFRNYALVFTQTIWRYRGGDRYVPYLCWHGGRWDLYVRWLGNFFNRRYRLLRPRAV